MMDRVYDEEDIGNSFGDGKKLYEPEGSSSTDSEDDDIQYGARRRKPDRGFQRGNKTYVEKNQGRGKILIFSPTQNHENGRGRGRDNLRGRGRGGRSTISEDRDDGAGYSKKNYRMKNYDKDPTDNSEDGRIGRQLRLLARETDEDVITKICQQLQEAFMLQDNARYIRYNLVSIGNSLLDTYKLVNSFQTRKAVSQTIARLGYVSDHDFNCFVKWVLSAYQKEANEKTCCSIMEALTEMLKMNEGNSRLKNVDTLLLPGLQTALESADTPDLFEATLNPVLSIAIKNPTTFLAHFRDTVDILVGWFIDPAQPAKVTRSASKALQTLRPFWKDDQPFSKTLLSQFLEDLDAYTEETSALLGASETPSEENLTVSLRKIASLLNVFVVVGAQVCTLPENSIYTTVFLNNALSKVSLCSTRLLHLTKVGLNIDENAVGDIILFTNECSSLLVGWLGSRIVPDALKLCMELLVIEVESAVHYEYPLLVTMLHLMTCLAEQQQVASQLSLETIQRWMDLCNWLIRSSRCRDILCRVAKLLRTMIKVKNVPLLIEVYRRLVMDLEECFIVLRGDGKNKQQLSSETEENALLLLSPLADLGRSSSFVGMWALDPSLLELLIGKLQPIEQIRFLASFHPSLLLGVLRVLHCHAKSHSHFVANSGLLANATTGNKNLHGCTSPTSGNLSSILNLLTDLCLELGGTSTCQASKILLLQWCGQLLDTCKPCTSQLNQSEIFQRFLSSMVTFCHDVSSRLPSAVESVLSALLDLPEITLKTKLAVQIARTCIHQLRNGALANGFLQLLGRCPPQIVQEASRRVKDALLANLSLASWIQNEAAITARNSQHFFDYIVKGVPIPSFESLYGFHMGTTKSSIATPENCDLPLWLAVQSALLCVNSKLRVPLGKPQDTFLTIEDAIKSAAARPSGQETVTEQNIAQLTRTRLLLSFYEMLERFMYNAFDGCSIAVPLAPKVIRVFFRTNQTTCQEWVRRMANAALTASVRAGRHASAVRYGLDLLSHWSATRRTVDVSELENVLHQLVGSLVKLNASQQIRGLKKWLTAPQQNDFFECINIQFLDAAALQADLKHEEAIKSYSAIQPSPFICNQVVNSYTAVADWEGFLQWKNSSVDWLAGQVQLKKQMAELVEYFDLNVQLEWPEKPTPPVEMEWAVDSLVNDAKSGLLVAADRIRTTRSVYPAPTSAWKIIENVISSSFELSHLTVEGSLTSWLPLAHVLSYKNESAYLWMEHTRSVLKVASCTELPFSESAFSLEWSRWLRWYSSLDGEAVDILTKCAEIDLATVSLARSEGNLRLAERQLLKGLISGQSHDLATQLMNEALKMKLTSTSNAKVSIRRQLEGAKLLYQKGETEAAISVLTQCSLALSRSLQSPQSVTVLPYVAESYTLLAKWLQQSVINATPLKNIGTLKELANADQEDHAPLVSKLMERASQFCPTSSEAWLAWGQFQYAGAQQRMQIDTLLSDVLPAKEASRLITAVDELTGEAERVLTSDPALNRKPAVLKRLLTEVQNRKMAAMERYRGALKAFLNYLNLRDNCRNTVDVTLRVLRILSRYTEEIDKDFRLILAKEIERTPTAAWRSITPQLLSLLQRGQPWFRILISQLLSRMASQWPQLLVFPIAVGAVGLAWSWSSDPHESGIGKDGEVEERGNECSAKELQTVYESMIGKMMDQVPEMVRDVRLLLTELRRLVLLWDELWVSILQQVHPQVEQVLQKLQAQGQKLNKKVGLNDAEKKVLMHRHFHVLFKPILIVLEAVASITNAPPETPHENWFYQRYNKIINDGIEQLRDFGTNPECSVHELWLPFKNMLQQLQHINYRRSVLKLDDVSPALRQMKDTRIPMPGVDGDKQIPTLFIASVENSVIVLPTKTKPKKFIFVGSNGKRYAYLFKGMEDLHLDQRIMQVLSLANVLLSDSKNNYRARHYGVIPLGPRSGLIQWVEGVTPLFALYKRWLQRQAASNAKGDKDNAVTAVPRPSELFYNKLTPLLEAEGLSADPRQRSQWPTEILRRVLAELMEETPKDLVARELWIGSLNSEQWWSSTLRFGRSCAVMSVIGYTIGLGDRHLDNVLVDLRCGEVVHIDYNVCFEKGRQLRVPENVPFRLTANIQHALGAAGTGLEGTFRLSCIDVMQMMRDNRELFLILLEHFVYDPLIDWKSPVPSGAHESTLIPLYVVNPALAANCSRQKRKTETDATFELFQLRTSELGPDWSVNQVEMSAIISALKETALAWADLQIKIGRLQEEVQDLHQDRLVLFDIRSDKKHVMRQPQQLAAILLPLRTAWEGEKTVRATLKTIVEDNAKWIQLYEMAFNSLTSGQLKKWAEDLRPHEDSDPETGFPLVSDFLSTSGQTSLVQQGQVLEQQVRSLKENQQAAALVVMGLLGTYTSLAAQYTPDKLGKHRTQLFFEWAKELEDHLCTETCQRLAAGFQELFDPETPSLAAKQQRVVEFNLSLRRLLNEATLRLHKASMQLSESDPTTTESDLIDAKEAISSYAIVHGLPSINYATLSTFYRVYKEIDTLQYENAGAFEDLSVEFGVAYCIAELALFQNQVIKDDVAVVCSLKHLHQDIEEFIFNGTTIVLPELIRLFECFDPSILHLHEELETLCIEINMSKMEITRLRFQDLLGESDDARLTQGQMLLWGLNGLFEKMEATVIKFAEHLKAIPALEVQLDFIDDLHRKMESELFVNLEDTLMAQRLRLMMSIFQSCSDWAEGFKTGEVSRELQNDSFVDKFERIAAGWAGQFLPGATSYSIARICVHLTGSQELTSIQSLEEFLTVNAIEETDEVFELLARVETISRRCDRIKLAHHLQLVDTGLAQFLQQQLTAHSWLHDSNAGINSACGLFALNMRQSLSVLLSQSPQLTEIHQQVTLLAAQVEQRLRWAAGANPDIHKLMEEFSKAQNKCLQSLQESSSLATTLGSISSAILHYESFRTRTPEALTSDSAFVQLLSQCQDVCLLKDCGTNGRLSEAELRLAQNVTLEDRGATEDWINETEKTISENIQLSKDLMSQLILEQDARAEDLRQMNAAMRAKLTVHHQLISDVRSVLKTMAKCEVEDGPVTSYLEKYRQYSELCSSVSRHLAAKEYDSGKMSEIQSEIHSLQNILDDIYFGLEQLSGSFAKAEIATKKTYEVNATAAAVWHRVRLKLEGRDPDPKKQFTVEEQVDAIIEEATNLDNLALLYEGWTPWV